MSVRFKKINTFPIFVEKKIREKNRWKYCVANTLCIGRPCTSVGIYRLWIATKLECYYYLGRFLFTAGESVVDADRGGRDQHDSEHDVIDDAQRHCENRGSETDGGEREKTVHKNELKSTKH